MKRYIAVVHHEPGTSYGISFPDFPGCISAGDTFEDAVKSGTDALAAHAAWMRQDGDAIPEPRDLAEIKAEEDWIDWTDAVVTLVPLLPSSDKVVRVNVTMNERDLAEIDAAAQAWGMTRSAFLVDAAKRGAA